MCFSATASFASSVLLVPVGIHCLRKSRDVEPGYGLIAAFPLLFGVQQAFEGLLWLSLGGNDAIDALIAALAFLFFAYFLWPFLVPMASWRVERERTRRRLFLSISVFGLAFGALLYLPLLLVPDALSFRLVRGSILYEPTLLFDPFVPHSVFRAIYALLVAVPLVMSSEREVRRFGAIILGSVIISALIFEYAFVSIWCFFAALISIYMVFLFRSLEARAPVPPSTLRHA